MALTRPTLNQIYTRILTDMQARVTSGTKIPKVSLLGVLAVVFAGAIHLLYGFVLQVSQQLMVDKATGKMLDRWALLFKLPRKSATFATGSVMFTGNNGAVIPEGTEIQNNAGYIYSTVSEATVGIAGTVIVDIQADEEGSASNDTAAVFTLVAPLADVETDVATVTNPNGGQDLETDAALRTRLLQRMQNPPSSGTAADYERWALEIAGVGRAWCKPAEDYAGAGTVGVVVASLDLSVVDTAVKEAAQNYIDINRPAGVRADVLDPTVLPVEVVLDLSENTTAYQDSITSALTALFEAESTPGGTVLLSHIRSAISSTGVTDFNITDIIVDGSSIGVANITTEAADLAAFETLTTGEL